MIKPIPEYPNYFADTDGNVWSDKKRLTGKQGLIKLCKILNSRRYHIVNLRKNGVGNIKKVGVIVLETFVGVRPNGHVCCHGKNGKLDDSLENVSWGTEQKNNREDKLRDGTLMYGEKCWAHKLNEWQVRVIRKAYDRNNGVTQQYLGNLFGVTKANVCYILKNKGWLHIS
jgi:NUMOD4 motif.